MRFPIDSSASRTSHWRGAGRTALLLVLLAVVTRLPLLVHNRPIDDEGMYTVVANVMLDGGLPYANAVERKPPLLFWTYSAIFAGAGRYNWLALHLTALAWTLLTMAGLYVIGAEVFDRRAGAAAAFLYCVFQPWANPNNLAFNGELMMNLPLVWAWALVLHRPQRRRLPALAAAGVLLGAAFLLKQPAAIAAVPMGVYLLLPSYRSRHAYSWRESVGQAAALTTGFIVIVGVIAAILWRQGILADAIFWTITAHDVPFIFWSRAAGHTAAFVGACLPLCLAAAAALRFDAFGPARRPERFALVSLAVVSAIGVAASGRFYVHYFIQLVPPLALLAAPIVASSAALRAWVLVTAAAFVTAAWIVLPGESMPSDAARYIRQHSAAGDRIFVWGQAPGIYLDAERQPATRYITTFPLTGYIFGPPLPGLDTRSRIIPGAWQHFSEDMTAHPARLIVDVQSDPAVQYAIGDFPILARLLFERYHRVAVTHEGVVYRLNDAASSGGQTAR